MEADQTRGEAGLPCAVSAAKRKRDDEAEEVPQQHKAPKKKLSKRERRELRHKHQKALPLRPSDAADQAPVVVAAAAERDQPPYIIDSDKGLRRVGLYHYEFKTHAKGRWVGRTVLDVFAKEFSAHSLAYYHEALKDGRIRLNGQIVDEGAVVQEHDVLSHLIHRHEPPVTSAPIRIVHQSDELVVIDKPASIPLSLSVGGGGGDGQRCTGWTG
ncbi:uncharacterized protein ACA1_100040 [Acanthamoeba castellanii str. Neff]|uniref:Uncharacterized protein n=1 Tax=Acanthamoeba castellanii (strain ATCC 30010 / Neff) TaxID=1257118 RepID=L8GK38_ACACF|nr:uncharacterized protein ACA1_100040 [Acanthamoeba castellanii str. Neff]ELR13189.1 hypothetical protein ACA1_100040 [Acanthamoeba castellanii str. Neff]